MSDERWQVGVRGRDCVSCGGAIEEGLERLGSLRCLDCRTEAPTAVKRASKMLKACSSGCGTLTLSTLCLACEQLAGVPDRAPFPRGRPLTAPATA